MTIDDNDMTKCHVCGIYNCVKNHMDNYTLANTDRMNIDENTFIPSSFVTAMKFDTKYGYVDPTVSTSIEYKYEEDILLKEIQEYIDATYTQHYSGKTQVLEWIMENMNGMDYIKGNVLKYVVRFGRKEGNNRKDIMKAIHYLMLMMYFSDKQEKDISE